jgi:hypothetical protein
MLEIDILFNLFMKGCMFITSATETLRNASLQNRMLIVHTYMLEEAWLLVLASHSHHFPPLALCWNLNPNGLLYPHAKSTNLAMPLTHPSHPTAILNFVAQSIDQSQDSRNHYLIIQIIINYHSRILGGCTVLNLYESTWVHKRGIDLDLAILRIHTIDTLELKKFTHTYIKHIFNMEYMCIQRY